MDHRTAGIKCGRIDGPFIRTMFKSIPPNANLIEDEFLGNENMEMPYVS